MRSVAETEHSAAAGAEVGTETAAAAAAGPASAASSAALVAFTPGGVIEHAQEQRELEGKVQRMETARSGLFGGGEEQALAQPMPRRTASRSSSGHEWSVQR